MRVPCLKIRCPPTPVVIAAGQTLLPPVAGPLLPACLGSGVVGQSRIVLVVGRTEVGVSPRARGGVNVGTGGAAEAWNCLAPRGAGPAVSRSGATSGLDQ